MDTGYIEGIGTVRECIDCGVVVAGGPTRCMRCAKFGPPRRPVQAWIHKVLWRHRITRRLFKGATRSAAPREKLEIAELEEFLRGFNSIQKFPKGTLKQRVFCVLRHYMTQVGRW